MAFDMKMEGLEELSAILGRLDSEAELVASGALYEGAGVIADAMSNAVDSIKTAPFKYKRESRMPSPEEKEALRGKIGIAKFRKNGSEVDTIVGFTRGNGYVMLGKRKTAVRLIARSINSGTSFMDKQPVFRKAASKTKASAEAAMVAKAENILHEIIGS